jgi:hypothetical protein
LQSKSLCWVTRPELLGEPNEKSFRAADVTEPINVFILNDVADELRAMPLEPDKRVVDIVHSEHDAQVAERVHRGVPVIGNDGRGKESRKLEATVTVWSDQHGDLDVLMPQSGDAPSPLSFDRGSPFESQAKLDEKWDRGIEGFYHDAYVVHPLKSHILSDPS